MCMWMKRVRVQIQANILVKYSTIRAKHSAQKWKQLLSTCGFFGSTPAVDKQCLASGNRNSDENATEQVSNLCLSHVWAPIHVVMAAVVMVVVFRDFMLSSWAFSLLHNIYEWNSAFAIITVLIGSLFYVCSGFNAVQHLCHDDAVNNR